MSCPGVVALALSGGPAGGSLAVSECLPKSRLAAVSPQRARTGAHQASPFISILYLAALAAVVTAVLKQRHSPHCKAGVSPAGEPAWASGNCPQTCRIGKRDTLQGSPETRKGGSGALRGACVN